MELRHGCEANLVERRAEKQWTIAFSSGEAELVAALSGACEGMGLRQQELVFEVWNAEET